MAGQGMPEPPAAKQPSDYRNGDLVSRLLAATPPYLYNMPLLPNSFFFSEMLRSFVQAKSAASASSQGQGGHQATGSRRGRKRTWKETTRIHHPHHHTLNTHPENNNNNVQREPVPDKPLELTTGPRSTPPPPPPPPQNNNPPSPLPPTGLLLNTPEQVPPPPPIWYPPTMYHPPPYTSTAPPFDPLHFFIDLRVSGHIWDQTKNNHEQESGNNPPVEPLDLQTDQKLSANVKSTSSSTPILQQPEQMSLFKSSRKHMSAFAVPRPREMVVASANAATYGIDDPAKLNKSVDGENNNQSKTVSTNYVLQNLSKIYKEVESKSKNEDEYKFKENEDEVLEVKEDVDEDKLLEKEKKTRDLRALIGLELVKDYVSFEGRRYPKGSCIPLTKENKNGGTSGMDMENNSELKKEAPEKINDVDDDSNIQVDDDSDCCDNDSIGRSMNNARGDNQYIDYSQTRLQE